MKITVINRTEKINAAWGVIIFNIMRGSSALANPFKISPKKDRMTVLKQYRDWLWKQIKAEHPVVMKEFSIIAQAVIQGKDVYLECCCKPKDCHGDILKAAIEWYIEADRATMHFICGNRA
jgi:hypothetical protein